MKKIILILLVFVTTFLSSCSVTYDPNYVSPSFDNNYYYRVRPYYYPYYGYPRYYYYPKYNYPHHNHPHHNRPNRPRPRR